MFTGIVEGLGRIERVDERGRDRRLRIEPAAGLLAGIAAGDSIAVDGACLTAAERDAAGFWADVSAETLAYTTLGERGADDAVNLERALLPTTRLGGHLVAGHVDGVGSVVRRGEDGRAWWLEIRVPAELARYVAVKGSICVDGISLTVNAVNGDTFGIHVVPHTMTATTIGARAPGACVNIEVDVIARYLERLLAARAEGEGGADRDPPGPAGWLGK